MSKPGLEQVYEGECQEYGDQRRDDGGQYLECSPS